MRFVVTELLLLSTQHCFPCHSRCSFLCQEFLRLGLPKVSVTDGIVPPLQSDDAPAKSVGLFYGTTSKERSGHRSHGRTKAVAELIANATGLLATSVGDVDENFDFHQFDSIIVGTSTYNTGAADHRSLNEWDDWLYDALPDIDIRGKNVAVFCTGKQEIYHMNFCDSAGELYDRFGEAGANMMGFSSTDGYNFTHSKAIRNGKFIGKMFDQAYHSDLSEGRVNEWVEQLRNEGVF